MAKILKKDQIDEEVSLVGRLELEAFADDLGEIDNKIISPQTLVEKHKKQEILDGARKEAAAIREEARQLYLTVENKIKEASEKGHAEGREEGLASVTELLAKIRKDQEEVLKDLEKQALNLVVEIAHKVLGDALKTSDEALLGLIREALKESMGNELVVMVNPDDFEKMREKQNSLLTALQGSQTLQIKASAAVRPGSCMIESELGTLEAQLDLQLAAIKRALGIEDGGCS